MSKRKIELAEPADPAGLLRKLPRHVSFADYVDMVPEVGDKNKLREELLSCLEESGPAGAILASTELTLADGTQHTWSYLRPGAILAKMCSLNGAFALRVACYQDEIKPGNVLRPDAGRTLCCLYWCLMDLPSWALARTGGWVHFATFPYKLLDKLPGGYSSLFARMLNVLEADQGHFTLFAAPGLPIRAPSGNFWAKGCFGLVVSDEKALKEVWSLRGASGTKPCVFCKNIVGHMDKEAVAEHAYLVHYSSSSPNRFDQHTRGTFRAMVDNLEDLRDHPAQLKRLGQLYGLTYSPQGVLWDPVQKARLCPPLQTQYDWMHVLIACGGLAQYEVNEWVKLVAAAGVSLAQLDRFARKIRMPKVLGKLHESFFQSRVSQEPNTCIKCFGGELLLAAPILELFMQMCVRPASILEEHCQCLQHLLNILALLGLHSAVLPRTATLRAEIVSHNDLFRRLYPNCVKPKFHWMYHLADCIERFRVNLCCFAPERKHRSVKELAAHVTNHHLATHVTTRLGYDTLQFFQDEQHAFEAMNASKGKPKELAWAVAPMCMALQEEAVTVHGWPLERPPAWSTEATSSTCRPCTKASKWRLC